MLWPLLWHTSLCSMHQVCTNVTRHEFTLNIFLIFLSWIFFSAGQATLFVYLNCFVHAVMYTYYLLSISKPMGIIPSVTMKKNITRLQIVSNCYSFLRVCAFLLVRSFVFYLIKCIFLIDSIIHYGFTFWTWARDPRPWLWLSQNLIVFGFDTKFIYGHFIYEFLSTCIRQENGTTPENRMRVPLWQRERERGMNSDQPTANSHTISI